ncbi:MAG: exonuclease domain-containing protein [Pseudomonadota bacterium]
MATLAKSEHAVLRDYATSQWPDLQAAADTASYLALDFELDGLSDNAHLLQAGWVPIDGRSIPLVKAVSLDIRSNAELNDVAVTIHGIGEQRAAQGTKLGEAIPSLIKALAGRILIAHCASIEIAAIQRATKALYGVALPVRSVCTLTLERHLRPNLVGPEVYRLGPTRARYGLPNYPAHDALTDAIAAAELFQAQLSRMSPNTRLRDTEGV